MTMTITVAMMSTITTAPAIMATVLSGLELAGATVVGDEMVTLPPGPTGTANITQLLLLDT